MEVSGQLHAPAALPLDKNVASTHWIGVWVGIRACLEAVEKRKILHCRESNPDHAAHSLLLYQLSYPDSYLILGSFTKIFQSNVIFFNIRPN
jgi:hypothetical protein